MEKSKILIVDDAIDTVELLKKRFRAEGYDTEEAYNGEEGLQKVEEYTPDLVVLDIMMPKIDGYEVCQRLKADEKTKYVPVLMLTAKGEVEHKIKGLDIGADDYLAKPFDYKELSARVRSLLTTKAAHEKKVEVEKSSALEQMMDQVAHEIRNPLTSIGGFARKVYNKMLEGDPNRQYLEMIINDVTVLESMIKELIELKSMSISMRAPSSLNEILKDTLNVFSQEIQNKSIEVKAELSENLPTLNVDKKLLKRAFCNLIKNAIEAMETEKRILTITSKQVGSAIEIQISDTGKGMEQEKIKNIFDPLVTSKVYGPGLGLTFSQKIIQDHGGNISVESEPDKGATFTVSFPVKET